MKLYDYLSAGPVDDPKYNCSEKIVYGANAAYGLGLDQTALKLSAGFGAGMGQELTCGVLTGSVMVLSHLFVKEYCHEGPRVHALIDELFQAFKTTMRSIECVQLKKMYRTPEQKCRYVILQAAKALDEIVEREREII